MPKLKEQISQRNMEKDKPSNKQAKSKDGIHESGSGIRQTKTTSVFRIVNFELYAKQNTFTMVLGASLFLGAVGYITYMRFRDTKNNEKKYNAMDEDGRLVRRTRESKWD